MDNKIFAAIDVGTTTVAVSLIDEDNRIIIKDGFLNPQHRFGSDVISRITLSERGDNLNQMRDILLRAVEDAIERILNAVNIALSDVQRAVITANTAMASIILGKKVISLGRAPFTMPFDEETVINLCGEIPCHILPGASAFIGADSAAGAMYINKQDVSRQGDGSDKGILKNTAAECESRDEKYPYALRDSEMLIDLGTNGEMILNDGRRMLAASAACGPAFENSTRARGIYGRTTLSAIAYMLKRGELDRSLVLDEEFIANGRDINVRGEAIHLDARIIREIQLAVAAIYASAVFLIEKSDIGINDIKRLFIAGGFGFALSLSDAETIGLLPAQLLDKAVISGNTSLLAAECLAAGGGFSDYDSFRKRIITVQTGGNDRYEELFGGSMTFVRR